MATCANHPLKTAVARCKACNKPLCAQCRRITDIGIFCSPECEAKTRKFMERVGEEKLIVKRTLFTARFFRGVKWLAILLVVFAAVMYFGYGARSWQDVMAVFRKWWEYRHLLF